MTIQLDILSAIKQGERLRDAGLKRAIDHANADFPQWKERAYTVFKNYISNIPKGRRFKTEDARIWAYANNMIEKPATDRAWGFAAPKAARECLIICVGTMQVVNKTAHRCFASYWEKI